MACRRGLRLWPILRLFDKGVAMRIETTITRGPNVAKDWGSDPNLRAEIKMDMAMTIARMLRTHDLIDFVMTVEPNGDTKIVASIDASSTGDERRAAGLSYQQMRQ